MSIKCNITSANENVQVKRALPHLLRFIGALTGVNRESQDPEAAEIRAAMETLERAMLNTGKLALEKSQDNLSENLTDHITGFGTIPIRVHSNRLHLPAQLCHVLREKLETTWLIFILNPKCLIAFPACLQESFPGEAQDVYPLTQEQISDFKKFCWVIKHKSPFQKKLKKIYKTEYWILPALLIKQLDFPENKPNIARSKRSFKCLISPKKYWLEINVEGDPPSSAIVRRS